MHKPTPRSARPRRRRIIVLAAAATLTVAAITAAGFGLVQGPRAAGPTRPGTADRSASRTSGPAATATSPAPVVETSNPAQFARRVAVAVFTWDTTTGYGPSDYMQQVMDIGDPSGIETPGLAADLADYLPTATIWTRLAQYDTRQWLTIDTAVVPSDWAQALRQGRGTLAAGTTAYTITGTRHRAGMWDGKPVTTAGRVSFTVFETCQPTYPTCRLLRLSQLDNPLH